MKVLILCGGQGTRAYPYTQRIPKALMPVAGRPVVEQVMRIYAAQGFTEFVLAGGHLIEEISRYFQIRPGWDMECVDTGVGTDTAGRVRRCLDRLGERFHVTYCDGLGDVNLQELVRFHAGHGDGATLTACPLRSQYGILRWDDEGRVTQFVEKPVLADHWINAGFFVFDRETFAATEGENLERDVLPALAEQESLRMFRHQGFWRSMDTYKDQQELDRLWQPYSVKLDGNRPTSIEPLPSWLSHPFVSAEEGPA